MKQGQCCKCGSETQNEYAYYTADVFSSREIVTYENVEKHTAFLCGKCLLLGPVLGAFVYAALHAAVFLVCGITKSVWPLWLGIAAALMSGAILFYLVAILLDRTPSFLIHKEEAQRRVIDIMRKQNPDTAYLTTSDYKKRIGGVSL